MRHKRHYACVYRFTSKLLKIIVMYVTIRCDRMRKMRSPRGSRSFFLELHTLESDVLLNDIFSINLDESKN